MTKVHEWLWDLNDVNKFIQQQGKLFSVKKLDDTTSINYRGIGSDAAWKCRRRTF